MGFLRKFHQWFGKHIAKEEYVLNLTVFAPGEKPVTVKRKAPSSIEQSFKAAYALIHQEAGQFSKTISVSLQPLLAAHGRRDYVPQLSIVPTEWGYDLLAIDLENLLVMRITITEPGASVEIVRGSYTIRGI